MLILQSQRSDPSCPNLKSPPYARTAKLRLTLLVTHPKIELLAQVVAAKKEATISPFT